MIYIFKNIRFFKIILLFIATCNCTFGQEQERNLILELLNTNQNITNEMLVENNFKRFDTSLLKEDSLDFINSFVGKYGCCDNLKSEYFISNDNSVIITISVPKYSISCDKCRRHLSVVFYGENVNNFHKWQRYFKASDEFSSNKYENYIQNDCYEKSNLLGDYKIKEIRVCFKVKFNENKKIHIIDAMKYNTQY
jgi:hypothetical protein